MLLEQQMEAIFMSACHYGRNDKDIPRELLSDACISSVFHSLVFFICFRRILDVDMLSLVLRYPKLFLLLQAVLSDARKKNYITCLPRVFIKRSEG